MASLSTPGTFSAEDRASIDSFQTNVLEESLHSLVLVRFTASWCGPCKQLAPIIDKVIAESAGGRVKQVVVDIDKERLLAEQFRIQSVPTVYAFLGGQPVDGFVGARSEREVKAFVDRLVQALPPSEEEESIDSRLAAAGELLAGGHAGEAVAAFAHLVQEAPDRADAAAGYARSLLATGEVDGAAAALAAIPADSKDPAVLQARSAVELARAAAPSEEMAALERRIAVNPLDHQARIDLAQALFARGEQDAAAEQLFQSIAADRSWNDGAARAQLLKLIEAQGLGDPWSVAVRRRLSQVLFS